MRDRLIELLEKADETVMGFSIDGDVGILADHLLAEGVIVPPCKVGQKVYIIGWCGDIEEFVIRDVHLCTDEKGNCSYRFRAVIGEESDIHFYAHYIGVNVFLTREEAEKALAERSENGKS